MGDLTKLADRLDELAEEPALVGALSDADVSELRSAATALRRAARVEAAAREVVPVDGHDHWCGVTIGNRCTCDPSRQALRAALEADR